MHLERRMRVMGALVSAALCLVAFGSQAEPAAVSRPSTTAPPLRLTDQRGERFALAQLQGKTVVLNFIFTHCPTVCPLQTQRLNSIQRSLPRATRSRVHFVSVSIDPERDTPAKLREFAAKQRIDLRHWTLVTGTRDAVDALGMAYSAQAVPPSAEPLDHRTEVHLIDARGRLMQTYRGTPLDEARLAREIRAVDGLFPASPSP